MDKLPTIFDEQIVKSAVTGFETKDVPNFKISVFLDMVVFYGDCPDSVSASDVKGHAANDLCTFRTFRKRRGFKLYDYMYSTKIYNRRLSHTRMDAIREILCQYILS